MDAARGLFVLWSGVNASDHQSCLLKVISEVDESTVANEDGGYSDVLGSGGDHQREGAIDILCVGVGSVTEKQIAHLRTCFCSKVERGESFHVCRLD